MKFSITTACYNSMDKIQRAIGSVRGQKGYRYEHIIQDGGSSNGSVDWLNRQSNLDVCSEPDSGMYQAINRGWARATGDIFSWLNCDEQYLPGTLEKVARAFAENPEVDVVWGNFICVDASGQPIAARREIPVRYLYMRNCTCYIPSCTVFFRKKLWESGILQLDETFKVSSDKDLYLRLLKAGHKFFNINEYLALFEVDEHNLSATIKVRVAEEGARIFNEYGAFTIFVSRKLIKLARYLEKWFRGAYRNVNIQYQYSCDEMMNHKIISACKIGSKFSFD